MPTQVERFLSVVQPYLEDPEGRPIPDSVLPAIERALGTGAPTRALLDVLEGFVSVNMEPAVRAALSAVFNGARQSIVVTPGPNVADFDLYRINMPRSPRAGDLDLDRNAAIQVGNGLELGYNSLQTGVIERLGSPVPEQRAGLTPEARAAMQDRTVGQALDQVAARVGASLPESFDARLRSATFYRPDALYWEGFCHSLFSMISNPGINAAVRAVGREGERGSWYQGEWLSMADLGRALGSFLGDVVLNNPDVIFENDVTARELFVALQNVGMLPFVADIWLDRANQTSEVWNQLFVSQRTNPGPVAGQLEEDLIALARSQGRLSGDSHEAVALPTTATYAVEYGDGNERDFRGTQMSWDFSGVRNQTTGDLEAIYLPRDLREAGLSNVPDTQSSDTLEYIWVLAQGVFEDLLYVDPETGAVGRPNPVIDNDAQGAFLRVVAEHAVKGVDHAHLRDFEQAVARGDSQEQLLTEFGRLGVANAYSPDDWSQAFPSLEREAFLTRRA